MFCQRSISKLDLNKLYWVKIIRVFESYLNSICSFFTFVLVARYFSPESIALYAVTVTASQFIVSFQNSYISYPIMNNGINEVKPIILNLLIIQLFVLALVFVLVKIFYNDLFPTMNPISLIFLLYAFPFYELMRKYYFNITGFSIVYVTIILRLTPLLLLLLFQPNNIEELTIFLAVPVALLHIYFFYHKKGIIVLGDISSIKSHIRSHRYLFASSLLEALPGFILLLVMQKALSPLFIGEFRKIQSIYGLLGPFFGYILLSRISSKSDIYMGKRQSIYTIFGLVLLVSLLYPAIHSILYKERFNYLSLLPFFVISYLFQGLASSQRATLISNGNYIGLATVGFCVVGYVTIVLLTIPRETSIIMFGLAWSMVAVIYNFGYWRLTRFT